MSINISIPVPYAGIILYLFMSAPCLTHNGGADQEQDRRQTCLPEGLSVAFACCEALRTAQQVNDPQRCSRERSDRLQRPA